MTIVVDKHQSSPTAPATRAEFDAAVQHYLTIGFLLTGTEEIPAGMVATLGDEDEPDVVVISWLRSA